MQNTSEPPFKNKLVQTHSNLDDSINDDHSDLESKLDHTLMEIDPQRLVSSNDITLASTPYLENRQNQPLLLGGAKPRKKEVKSNPLGFVYFTIYTVVLAANNYAQLGLFSAAPTISTIQLTFIRGVICSIMVVILLVLKRENIYQKVIGEVDRSSIKPLICRASQSAICVYIAF